MIFMAADRRAAGRQNQYSAPLARPPLSTERMRWPKMFQTIERFCLINSDRPFPRKCLLIHVQIGFIFLSIATQRGRNIFLINWLRVIGLKGKKSEKSYKLD